MKKLAIISNFQNKTAQTIHDYFKNIQEIETSIHKDFTDINHEDYNLIACFYLSPEIDYSKFANANNLLNLHQSLLPAFESETPIIDAIKFGSKVTGITIHKPEKDNFTGKILTQYPILIGLSTHYDTLLKEFEDIETKIYPLVIDAIISDKVFDYTDILKSSCSRNCGSSCSGHCK